MTLECWDVAAGSRSLLNLSAGRFLFPLAALRCDGRSGRVRRVGRSCLIVDDSAAFRSSAAALLVSQGVNVVGCAASSDEALELVEEFSPELALVDVDLGDEDGLALARELAGRRPRMAVVLVSAYEQSDAAELLAGSTARGFLSKRALSAQAIEALLA